jgi:hypothetical protein
LHRDVLVALAQPFIKLNPNVLIRLLPKQIDFTISVSLQIQNLKRPMFGKKLSAANQLAEHEETIRALYIAQKQPQREVRKTLKEKYNLSLT